MFIAYDRLMLTPVELECFTGLEGQRHKCSSAEVQRPHDTCNAVFTRLCDEFIVEYDTWIDRAEHKFQHGEQ